MSRSSHLYSACRSVCDRDQESWLEKIILDRLIIPFGGSWLLDFTEKNVATPPLYPRNCIDQLILVAQILSWSLDRLLKETSITWFHFDPGCKCLYRWRVCDYPLHGDPAYIHVQCHAQRQSLQYIITEQWVRFLGQMWCASSYI